MRASIEVRQRWGAQNEGFWTDLSVWLETEPAVKQLTISIEPPLKAKDLAEALEKLARKIKLAQKIKEEINAMD